MRPYEIIMCVGCARRAKGEECEPCSAQEQISAAEHKTPTDERREPAKGGA